MRILLILIVALTTLQSQLLRAQEMVVSYGRVTFGITNQIPFDEELTLVSWAVWSNGSDQVSVNRMLELNEQLEIRYGIDVTSEPIGINIISESTFTDTLLAGNYNPRYRIGLPAQSQFRFWKFYLFAGVEPSFYLNRNQSEIKIFDEGNLQWTEPERADLKSALNAIKSFSFGYKYGVLFKPFNRIGLELIYSEQLTNIIRPVEFQGATYRPDIRYRATTLRFSYFFSINKNED